MSVGGAIHSTAVVGLDVKLGSGVQIGAYSLVLGGSSIGDGVRIGHHCVIEGAVLGPETRLRSFVELRSKTRIGRGCYIDSGVKSSGDVTIGDEVTVRYDAILARGVRVGDRAFIAPQVMTINLDHEGNAIGGAHIGAGCHIGTATVLHPGIRIAPHVVIGAKSLVTSDCDKPGIYVGTPARFRRAL